jgi:rhodanese-related sulfurtransferase
LNPPHSTARPRPRPLTLALAIAFAATLPALATAFLHPRRPDWSQRPVRGLDAAAVRAAAKPPLWIDARPAAAQAAGKIPGAIALGPDRPWEQALAEIAAAWNPAQPIVVYCEDEKCPASREVAARLRTDLGTTEIFFLRGGWAAWSGTAR